MEFKNITVPESGEKITHDYKGNLIVPDNPIIPFIEILQEKRCRVTII